VLRDYLQELGQTVNEVTRSNRIEFGAMGERLGQALASLSEASVWLGEALQSNPQAALAGATPYLRLFGITAGGCYLARCALAAGDNSERGERSVDLARFFAENIAVLAPGLSASVISGAGSVLAVPTGRLSA
jgi:hypothetical protein